MNSSDEARRQIEKEIQAEWHRNLDSVQAALDQQPLNWSQLADAWHDLPVVWTIMRQKGMGRASVPRELTEWLKTQVGAAIEQGGGQDEQDRVRRILEGALPVLRDFVQHNTADTLAVAPSVISPAPATVASVDSPSESEEPEWRYMAAFFSDVDAVIAEIEQAIGSAREREVALEELHRLKGSAASLRLLAFAQAIHRAENAIRRIEDGDVGQTLREYLNKFGIIRVLLQARDVENYQRLAEEIAQEAPEVQPLAPLKPVTPAVRRPAPVTARSVPETLIHVPLAEIDFIAESIFTFSSSFARIQANLDTSALAEEMAGEILNLRKITSAMTEHQSGEGIRASGEQRVARVDPLALSRFTPIETLKVALIEATDGLETHMRAILARLQNVQLDVERGLVGWRGAREKVTALRTIQWEEAAGRLQQAASAAADHEQKVVEVVIENPGVRLDRKVVDAMRPGLEAVVRNAVSHGAEVERPADKPAATRITLTARQAGSGRVEIAIGDDGPGINMARLLEKARSMNIDPPAGGWDLESPGTREILLRLLLERGGVSSRESANLSAGRGVGVKYAYKAVRDLGGRLDIWSKQDHGTVFTFVLPVSLDVATILPVRAGGFAYGIPIDAIESGPHEEVVLEIDRMPEWRGGGTSLPLVMYRGAERPVLPLDAALGLPRRAGKARLIGLAESDLVLAVQSIEGAPTEMVVRAMDPLLSGGPFVAMTGAPDGSPLFVLDIWALSKALRDQQLPYPTNSIEQGATARRRRVLIADDSVVVRQNLSEHVEEMGHEAIAVSDGVKAWELFASDPLGFAVLVTDLEMPNMNGLELISAVRKSEVHPDIPILVVTSRTARSHAEQVHSAGGSMLLSKPCNRDTFTFQLNRWLPTIAHAP